MRNHPLRFAMAALFLLSAVTAQTAVAQSCPHGYMPLGGAQAGWSGCAPMIQGQETPPDPGPQWATRWGAIAVDGKAGKFGAIDGNRTKRSASKTAIAECKRNGGRKCKVMLTYYNQCAALASGSTFSISYHAPEQEQAVRGALESCGQKDGDCRVYYAGCSYPQLIE